MSNDFLSKTQILRICTSLDISQQSLINAFSRFGKISMIESFPNLQMSIQEVLIEFESENEAKQALYSLNGTTLDNFQLNITYATNEQARTNIEKNQGLQSNEDQQISSQRDLGIKKEMVDDGLDKIINNEFKKEEQSVDVAELLEKYPELKAQIANPKIFKGLYDVFKKEYTKKMEQNPFPLRMTPEKLQEKIKSCKIAKKSGKPPPKRERKIFQESYSRSRSRSKSPEITPKKLDLKDVTDHEIIKKESDSEVKRKKFVYSSQIIENKEMNKAFDKNSDYWRLGLAMGVYPDMLPNSTKNLALNAKSEGNEKNI